MGGGGGVTRLRCLLERIPKKKALNEEWRLFKARSHDPISRIRFCSFRKSDGVNTVKNDPPTHGSVILKKQMEFLEPRIGSLKLDHLNGPLGRIHKCEPIVVYMYYDKVIQDLININFDCHHIIIANVLSKGLFIKG